jgi:PAS domain S-box-containing protein
LAILVAGASAFAAEPSVIRAGSEEDFRPYAFTDPTGQPTGFGPELLRAVADRMGLPLRITPGQWDGVWNDLVAGRLDVLPVVARIPGREPLVDFSLPHTETFDAFFVREGRPYIRDLAAAAGKEIVVLRSDAAHHELAGRKFAGTIIPVESIAAGLRLVAEGRHDAFLCSKVIGVLERERAGIAGVLDGPVIPDYKRTFAFAVRKGNTELVEKLNQGLRIAKADGTYDRLYGRWLSVEQPPPAWWQTSFWQAIGMLGVVALIAATWLVVRKALELDYRQAQVPTSQSGAAPAPYWRYVLAVVVVAAGYAVRVGMEAWTGPGLPPFVTFYPVIMLVALLGGIGPGVLATALTVTIAGIWIIPHTGGMGIISPVDRLSMVLFCGLGLFMIAVAELYRRNRIKAAAFDREMVLRESEERYRHLVDQAVDGIFLADPQGRYLEANPAGTQMLGYTLDEIRSLTVAEVIVPEDVARMPGQMSKLAEGAVTINEWRFRRKDGSTFTGEVVGRKLPDGRLLGILRDVTDRRQAEEALARAKEAAEAANRAKSDFLANLSHEIRTPLHAIASMAYLMRLSGLTPEQGEQLHKIESAGAFLLEIINAILDLSKIEAGKLDLEIGEVRVGALVANVVSICSYLAEEKHLVLFADVAVPGTPLRGDVTRLKQALLNYVGNAIKFSECGQITVRAVVDEEDSDSALIRFEVIDTGVGIEPEVIPRLFGAFEQVDNSTTRKHGGTGLGLAITKKLAQLMGGDAGADSIPGVGSTFWFTARLGKTPAVASPALRTREVPAAAGLREHHAGKRILLVEDEASIREMMAYLLKDIGLAVDTATDGMQAVELAGRQHYDLIVMDIQMAKLGGLEAARQIRRLPGGGSIPILALTGNAFAEDKARCLEAGMSDFIAKPAVPETVFAAILKWLEAEPARVA